MIAMAAVSRRGLSAHAAVVTASSSPVVLLLLMLLLRGTTAAQELDEDLMKASPLTVAQCRAGCLHKLLPRDVEATECEKKSDCWKCWKYCEVLQTEGKNMKNICERNCDAGCQEACSFHDWHGGSQPSPVVEARGERALTIDSGTLRWPRPADAMSPSSPRLVYVIMRRRDPGTRRTWSQLGQTPGYKAGLPETTAPCTVRVLAVSAEGLVTIYSPAPATTAAATVPRVASAGRTAGAPHTAAPPQPSPTVAAAATLHDLRDADVIIRSLGRDQILGIRLPLAARSAPQEESLRLMGDDPSDSSEVWNLREVSMIHQKVLVIAEVAWDARQVHRPAYLVTWEIAGGGLKGNLFTDTTCVTLSLWPDTAYLIQVSLLGGSDESVKMSTSPTLLLDTSRSAVHSTTAAAAAAASTAAAPAAVTAARRPTGLDYWNAGAKSEADADDDDGGDDDSRERETVAAMAGRRDTAAPADAGDDEDVTAELSAPVAVAAADFGHSNWFQVAAGCAGAATFLLLALVLAYRLASDGSPALHKTVGHDDAECPPLLDYAPQTLYFAKYLGRNCRKTYQLFVEDVSQSRQQLQQQPRAVTQIRH